MYLVQEAVSVSAADAYLNTSTVDAHPNSSRASTTPVCALQDVAAAVYLGYGEAMDCA